MSDDLADLPSEPSDRYWTLVDDKVWGSSTYEHSLPHGTLVRVRTIRDGGAVAESLVFIPNAPHSGGPYRGPYR